ncbi:PLP-dependent aminotransferase family protein [Polyangium fumosum]|uniref:PLP-dependent aminotransferase family protein n=1 Tax=Polyangium fumosum TaxID=889272 RepID=A0A4U1IZ96_9BACT|nr:PLP-dependent aminotransferase family protein [Polyangium fumosum]TKC99969.1 PLP-dependent aminotransferase family protein [Polyangium fumosum]
MQEETVTAGQGLLYERVAAHIEELIERGTLRPGDRIPSVRRLARQQGVSIATVLQAYLELENRGVIEARPQSGHYVRARRAPLPPEPRAARACTTTSRPSIGTLVARLYGAGRDPSIVPLGAGFLDPELLPTERLNRSLSLIARSAGGAGVGYDLPPGLVALRRQIARRSIEWGCALSTDDIVTTVGAAEALHLCLRAATRPGDTVAVESPAYYGLLRLLASLHMRVIEIPSHPRTGLDLSALAEAMGRHRIRAVMAIPNFNNPLGSLMPDEAKEELVEMLGRREIPLIEDDIYGDLHFGDERPRPAKAFDKRGLVMLCSSFSKTVAPGYRVGWAAPGIFREEVEHLKFAQSVATATLPQMAVADFLDNGGYDHHLRALRRKLAAQVERVSEAVAEHFPPGTRISRPAGGFLLWVELPPGTSALLLFERALARGIAIAPGPLFSAKQRFTGYIRLSCGHPWSELFDHAIRTLGKLCAECAG